MTNVSVGFRPPWCWSPSGRDSRASPPAEISINLNKTFLCISWLRKIAVTWILTRGFAYSPSIFSQILDFIYWTVLIFGTTWQWKPAIPRLHAVSLFSSVSHALERASSVEATRREKRGRQPEKKRESLSGSLFCAFPISRLQSRTCAFSRVLFDGLRKKRDCW